MVKGRVRTVSSLKGLGSYFHIGTQGFESVSQPLPPSGLGLIVPLCPALNHPKPRKGGWLGTAAALAELSAPFDSLTRRLRSTPRTHYEVVTRLLPALY